MTRRQTKQPRCSREFEAILDSAEGFTKRNGKGAHVVYKCPDGRSIIFTRQCGDLSPGLRHYLLKELLRYGLLAMLALGLLVYLLGVL